jgi:hypothetical protein
LSVQPNDVHGDPDLDADAAEVAAWAQLELGHSPGHRWPLPVPWGPGAAVTAAPRHGPVVPMSPVALRGAPHSPVVVRPWERQVARVLHLAPLQQDLAAPPALAVKPQAEEGVQSAATPCGPGVAVPGPCAPLGEGAGLSLGSSGPVMEAGAPWGWGAEGSSARALAEEGGAPSLQPEAAWDPASLSPQHLQRRTRRQQQLVPLPTVVAAGLVLPFRAPLPPLAAEGGWWVWGCSRPRTVRPAKACGPG